VSGQKSEDQWLPISGIEWPMAATANLNVCDGDGECMRWQMAAMANGSDGERQRQRQMAMAANGSGDKRQQWQIQQWRMAAAAAVINPVAIPLWWKLMAPLSPAVESCGIELVAHGSGRP